MPQENTQQEPTNGEILEAINDFSTAVEKRFDSIETRVTSIETKVTSIETRVTNIETRVTRTEALMVTKDYLDDKLAILRGDVLHVIRREDSRMTRLIDILHTRRVITLEDVNILEQLQPLTPIS